MIGNRPIIELKQYENEFIEYVRLKGLSKQAGDIAKDLRNWKKIKTQPPIPGFMTFIDLLTPEVLKEIASPVAEVISNISIALKAQAEGLVVGERDVQSEESDLGTQSPRD